MGQVEGKVAIVTGGARGIGAACARTLAREGAKVVVTDVDDSGGETFVAEVRKAGGEAVYLSQDVTVEARWPQLIAEVEKRYGGLHVMVANAGVAIRVPIVDMTLDDWRRQQAVNLDGAFLSVKYAVPAMRRSGGGSIVMMSSIAGMRGSPGPAIAQPKAACGFSPERRHWNARSRVTAFESTRCIPASSTPPFGGK